MAFRLTALFHAPGFDEPASFHIESHESDGQRVDELVRALAGHCLSDPRFSNVELIETITRPVTPSPRRRRRRGRSSSEGH